MSYKDKRKHLPFTEAEAKALKAFEIRRDIVSQRFPLWTALAATFGVVAIFYGTEKLIDRVPFFVNNPWTLIVFGVLVLAATNTTYKKL